MGEITHFLPTKPYTPIDNANRVAAAIGSPSYAMGAAHADYNGHHFTLDWNDYRQYYVLRYMWAGPNVISRHTEFRTILDVAIRAYDNGGRGASLSVCANTPEGIQIADDHPCLARWTKELEDEMDARWHTELHEEAAHRVQNEKRGWGPESFGDIVADWKLTPQCTFIEEWYKQ